MKTYDYPESNFHIHGFFKDAKWNGQLIGTFTCDEEKNRVWGYYGKKDETVLEVIKTSKNIIVPVGAVIETIYYPICGKLKVKPWEKKAE